MLSTSSKASCDLPKYALSMSGKAQRQPFKAKMASLQKEMKNTIEKATFVTWTKISVDSVKF